jgi:hypothetical protein
VNRHWIDALIERETFLPGSREHSIATEYTDLLAAIQAVQETTWTFPCILTRWEAPDFLLTYQIEGVRVCKGIEVTRAWLIGPGAPEGKGLEKAAEGILRAHTKKVEKHRRYLERLMLREEADCYHVDLLIRIVSDKTFDDTRWNKLLALVHARLANEHLPSPYARITIAHPRHATILH